MSEHISLDNHVGNKPSPETIDSVVIRFAGDSGDGIQLTGDRFTVAAALAGNDLRTLPDFPAEIRAPAGTLAGVSSFQISFSSHAVFTPGDKLDVLVAMNPASLRVNIESLRVGGDIIVNSAQFNKRNLERAGYTSNPLEDGSLSDYQLHVIDIQKLVITALEDMQLASRVVERCKNFFALGLVFWLYDRNLDTTLDWIDKKFTKRPELVEANQRALKAGYFFGDTTEAFVSRYQVKSAPIPAGQYRNISGNLALSLGLVAASKQMGRELYLGSYPITPASDILHALSGLKHFGVRTVQAEDEIAGICSAIGAAYGGKLAITTTSGPGLALKGEAMGLAVMTELPLVVVNVQRGGPSTGLPTKTEQSDLLQALYGRNGESPLPVLAAATPGDCFWAAFEACRLAVRYMTPVILLTDGYVANGTEPWRVPVVDELPEIEVAPMPSADDFQPYMRVDNKTLARPWAVPGMAGYEHRIGGLEKEAQSGDVSYDAANHELMVHTRQAKVDRIAAEMPPLKVDGDAEGDVLLVGWGSTYGAICGALQTLQQAGHAVSSLHLRYLNPLPHDLKEVFQRFKTVLVPELNCGQLAMILRAHTLIDVQSLSKVQGQPFTEPEIINGVLPYCAPKAESSLDQPMHEHVAVAN